MPVTNVVSVTGSSAFFDVHASNSGFGMFSSYSAFASEALTFDGSTARGTGSSGLSLDTSFGNLVFNGTDTITATANGYTYLGNETLSFVLGSSTVTYASIGYSSSADTTSQSVADLNNFYSSILTIGNTISLADSVAGTALNDIASDVAAVVNGFTHQTVLGGQGTSVTQNGVTFNFTKS